MWVASFLNEEPVGRQLDCQKKRMLLKDDSEEDVGCLA